MHVLKPSDIVKRNKVKKAQKRRKQGKLFLSVLLIGLILVGSFWALLNKTDILVSSNLLSLGHNSQEEPQDNPQVLSAPKKEAAKLRQLSGKDFRELYRKLNYPNSAQIQSIPHITGDVDVDNKIRKMAHARGFQLTTVPVQPIHALNSEKSLENSKDNLLQPLAKLAWQDLKSAAKADGIEIKVVSAYRSIERQRQLFLERLYSQGITLEQLRNGLGQDQIDMTLSLTAVPGYSRHHTGYTIDLACGDGLSFEDSVCNTWLAANNYEKAKFFGWIPSYPPDGGLQGPEPEAWEYVWVGTDVLHDD